MSTPGTGTRAGYARRVGQDSRHGPRPGGRAGSRRHRGKAGTGTLQRALGHKERQGAEGPRDGEGVSNEMRRTKTEECEQPPKIWKRKLNKTTEDRGEKER